MTGPFEPIVRPARDADMRPAFDLFRRVITAWAHRQGFSDSQFPSEQTLDEAWAIRRPWIEHLWRSSAENWVAVDGDERIVGWAMSVQRGSLLELVFYFVDMALQAKGVGRQLLDRAFPPGRGPHRAIVATQDPRALSRYLRAGVRYVTTVVDFVAAPRDIPVETDLELRALTASDASVALIANLEEALIGHRREIDTRLMLAQRPAWAAFRGDAPVGFAFGEKNELCGPMGALDPKDIPALLAHVESEAARAGATTIYVSTPLANDEAVRHLLGRGFRIDPFVAAILADDLSMRLDRWIHTGLSYIL